MVRRGADSSLHDSLSSPPPPSAKHGSRALRPRFDIKPEEGFARADLERAIRESIAEEQKRSEKVGKKGRKRVGSTAGTSAANTKRANTKATPVKKEKEESTSTNTTPEKKRPGRKRKGEKGAETTEEEPKSEQETEKEEKSSGGGAKRGRKAAGEKPPAKNKQADKAKGPPEASDFFRLVATATHMFGSV